MPGPPLAISPADEPTSNCFPASALR